MGDKNPKKKPKQKKVTQKTCAAEKEITEPVKAKK